MPLPHRFGPKCAELIEEHDILPLLHVDLSDPPAGELYTPTQTREEATERLTEFLEDLFEAAFEMMERR